MSVCLVSGGTAYAFRDVNQATCAGFPGTEESPGFRSGLPDCRAFELVTPPYKGGQPAFGIRHRPPPISPDGSRLLGIDFAGFADSENLENKSVEVGAIYSFSLMATGWVTEALEPSSEEAARSEYITANVDLTSSLWEMSNQAQEEVLEPSVAGYSLALRTKASQALTPIGRLTPPASPGDSEPVTVRVSRRISRM